jgi:aminopeptidase-like protein
MEPFLKDLKIPACGSIQDSLTFLEKSGEEMYALIHRLYPICRSITGNGVRETLRIIGKQIPLQIYEVPSHTSVFDWETPREWNIRDAFIKNSLGERVVDFQKCNLHVMSYSIPVHQKMKPDELKAHLFSLPDYADWIPYRTSYYHENWGFCVTHQQFLQLTIQQNEIYEVVIDSDLQDGNLTYGECFLPGQTEDEIIISCHICHPSLCNDNLSGISLSVALARTVATMTRRYSFRFLFIPGTIGSITWLSLNEDKVSRIKHGLVLTCVGDSGKFHYKKSRRGNADIDQVFSYVLGHSGVDCGILDFYPYGYDERQYCSPGFNLPFGVFMRSQHGTFPEYHTSADNLYFVRPEHLADSFAVVLNVLHLLEKNATFVNQFPKCEARLGKRGLFSKTSSGEVDGKSLEMAMLWVLNLSDGTNSLLDIAIRSGIDFGKIAVAAEALQKAHLLALKQAQGE